MAVYEIVPSNGKAFNWVREHSPDILTYTGIALMGGAVVAASIGTKKMIEEEDKIKEEPELIKRVWARSKNYVAATGLFTAGAFAVHKGHRIMVDRNRDLANELLAVTAGVCAYRDRWKKKVGEDEEKKIFLDEKTEEIVDDTGKKKKVKVTNNPTAISTDRYFDQWCSYKADDHGDRDLDHRTINAIVCMLNNELMGNPERYILLNHAYDMFGLYRTNQFGQNVDDHSVAGQVGGWILDKKNPVGDNTIYVTCTDTTRRLPDGRIVPTILMSFNIDGNIMEAAKERGLLQ